MFLPWRTLYYNIVNFPNDNPIKLQNQIINRLTNIWSAHISILQYPHIPITMNQSRHRQFTQFRNASQTRSLRSSTTSSIQSSAISQACVNCVNQIMAHRHRKAQKEEKEQARAEFRKNYQMVNLWVDGRDDLRASMKRDALEYNARMIDEKKKVKEHEKEEDLSYVSRVQKNLADAQQDYKNQLQQEKRRHNQYHEEIHHQYLIQLQKKDRQRFPQNKEQNSMGLPLYNPDTTKQKLQYKRQLQRQIEEKRTKEVEQRRKNQNKERQILEESKRQADRYHADNYQEMKMSKEEVFQGLRTLEREKKKRIEDDRKNKEQERMREIKEQNQQRSRAIKAKMKEMQNYVTGLKNQLLSKEEKLRSSKLADSNFFQKLPKSTEQLQAELQMKKTCKSCHRDYPQEYISPIPRKI